MGGIFCITRSERKRGSRNKIFQVVVQSPKLKYEK